MAFECQEKGDLSEKKFVSSCCGKGIGSGSVGSKFCSKSVTGKRIISKWVVARPKSVTGGFSKKDDGKLETTVSDDSVMNKNARSFTDLPPVLISEILYCLDAKELGVVSCVSTLLNSLATDHYGWKDLYYERWGLPVAAKLSSNGLISESQKSWKDLFVEREFRSKSFMGRFSIDNLHGHTEAIRAVFLLKEAKLVFTGGYDSVIRMWDMEDGLSIAVSRPLGCTIRAIVADCDLLVAGGTGAFLQCWRAVEGHPHLFDIAACTVNQNTDFRLWGHKGPITCLALDAARIYSGSWDMTVRIWDRHQLKCLKSLMHADWVWSLAPRGGTIASSAGTDVFLWDIESGMPVTVINNAHAGNTYSLTRSYLGDLLFTGGEDGSIHMYEVSNVCENEDPRPTATWIPHTGPVNSLAFEFPWLVSSSSDGRIALIDVRKLLNTGQSGSSRSFRKVKKLVANAVEPPQRMLHGFRCNLFSIDIGADRIICGGEEGVIRIWNFSEAIETEKRVQALRNVRLENRMRRRKAQIVMNSNSGRPDQCSVAAKRNQLNGEHNGMWVNRRGISRKVKA